MREPPGPGEGHETMPAFVDRLAFVERAADDDATVFLATIGLRSRAALYEVALKDEATFAALRAEAAGAAPPVRQFTYHPRTMRILTMFRAKGPDGAK